MTRMDTLTFTLPHQQREQLYDYADAQGVTMSECLRRLIAEKFIQLRQGEEMP